MFKVKLNKYIKLNGKDSDVSVWVGLPVISFTFLPRTCHFLVQWQIPQRTARPHCESNVVISCLEMDTSQIDEK